jgi:tRNA(Ile)-lysidine synthase
MGTDLEAHVVKSILDRRLLAADEGLLLAVSGGLDSTVLLHLMRRAAWKHGWRLVVAHYNHQLRGADSDADEACVRSKCRRLGLTCIAGRGNVRQRQLGSGDSIEMVARRMRHQFLAEAARQNDIQVIATGHHADDQAELFFLRLFRGAGSSGLRGMRWSNPSPADPQVRLIRPLLDLTRSELLAYARGRRLRFREDHSNQSLDYQRNKIRHQLLPLLTRKFQPALVSSIGRVMDILQAESDYLRDQAAQWLNAKSQPAFALLPTALQRWIVRLQLLEWGEQPGWDLVEHLRSKPAVPITVSPQRTLCRTLDGILLAVQPFAPSQESQECVIELSGAQGEFRLPGLKLRWQVQRHRAGGKIPAGRPGLEYFDANQVGGMVRLRHWKPGDRFQPIGMRAAVKLQDLFVNQKVPRNQRHERYLGETAQGEIFWVEGLRIGECCKIKPHTRRQLQWHWEHNDEL